VKVSYIFGYDAGGWKVIKKLTPVEGAALAAYGLSMRKKRRN
jgi:hypothetical protein